MKAPGILAISHDIAPGQEQQVRSWYGREHHFERLAIPGFVEVHRFDRLQGRGGAVLGLYRTRDVDVLSSEAYKARLADPTPATQTLMRHFRNMSRTVCQLELQAGGGEGGFLGVISVGRAPGHHSAAALAVLFERILSSLPVLRLRCIVAAPQAQPGNSEESRLRGRQDAGIALAVLVDAANSESAQRAIDEVARHLGVDPQSEDVPQYAVYRLAFAGRSTT